MFLPNPYSYTAVYAIADWTFQMSGHNSFKSITRPIGKQRDCSFPASYNCLYKGECLVLSFLNLCPNFVILVFLHFVDAVGIATKMIKPIRSWNNFKTDSLFTIVANLFFTCKNSYSVNDEDWIGCPKLGLTTLVCWFRCLTTRTTRRWTPGRSEPYSGTVTSPLTGFTDFHLEISRIFT